MRILFATDIHGRHDLLARLPEADLLLLGGDLTHFGTPAQVGAVACAAKRRFPLVLAVLGNCDPGEGVAELELEEAYPRATGTVADGLPVRVFGVGGANRSPFNTPNEWEDAAMARELASAALHTAPLPDSCLRILLSHPPPAGCGAGSLRHGGEVGSLAVAEFARRLRPDWILCGHLHENRGQYSLDGVPVVNPGPLRHGNYALLEWLPGQAARCVLATLEAI